MGDKKTECFEMLHLHVLLSLHVTVSFILKYI